MTEPIVIRTSDRKPRTALPIIVGTTKRCSQCGDYKAFADFNKSAKGVGGLQAYCRDCAREKARTRYHDEPEPYKARALAWQQAHPEYVDEYQNHGNGRRIRASVNARRGAQKRGAIEVSHVDRDFVFRRDEGQCGICTGFVDIDDWELDHIVQLHNGGSHTYENVRVTHPSCNKQRKWND